MNNIKKVIDIMNLNPLKIENVPESYSSEVCSIVLDNDKRVILKIPFTQNKLLKEYTMLKILQGKLPVPEVLGFWEGDKQTPGALLLSYIEGKPVINKINGELSYQMGKLLGKLHSIKVIRDDLGELDSLIYTPRNEWWSTIKKWFDNCFYDCKNFIDSDVLEGAVDLFNIYYKNLPNPDYPSFAHMDYRPGNILGYNNSITGILDFESARVGSADIDFAKAKTYIWDEFPNTKEAFIRGYKEIRPLPDLERSLPFYLLFDAFASVGWCIKRGKTNDEFYRQNMLRLREIVRNDSNI